MFQVTSFLHTTVTFHGLILHARSVESTGADKAHGYYRFMQVKK